MCNILALIILRYFDKMDRVLGCRPATQPILKIESQAEEEDGEDTQESAVSTNTSLITEEEDGEDTQESAVSTNTSLIAETDSDDDSEVTASHIL